MVYVFMEGILPEETESTGHGYFSAEAAEIAETL
jgi:hypothetical protein